MASRVSFAFLTALLLRQAALVCAQPPAVQVNTAAELLAHLQQQAGAGQPAIVEITDHMDARAGGSDQTPAAGDSVSGSLQQVVLRGNCTGSVVNSAQLGVPGLRFMPPLPDLKPNQCVIVLDSNIDFLAVGLEVWLDNIHFRVQRDPAEQQESITLFELSQSRVWMTNVTLESDEGPALALHLVEDTNIHIEDGVVRGFNDTLPSAPSAQQAPVPAEFPPPPPPGPPGAPDTRRRRLQQGGGGFGGLPEECYDDQGTVSYECYYGEYPGSEDPAPEDPQPAAEEPAEVEPEPAPEEPAGEVPDPADPEGDAPGPTPSDAPTTGGGGPAPATAPEAPSPSTPLSAPTPASPVVPPAATPTPSPQVAGGVLAGATDDQSPSSGQPPVALLEQNSSLVLLNSIIESSGSTNPDMATIHINENVMGGATDAPSALMVSGGDVSGGLVERDGSDMVLVSRSSAAAGEVYADQAFDVFNVEEGTVEPPTPLSEGTPMSPAPLLTADENPLKDLIPGASGPAEVTGERAAGALGPTGAGQPPDGGSSGGFSAAVLGSMPFVIACFALHVVL